MWYIPSSNIEYLYIVEREGEGAGESRREGREMLLINVDDDDSK